MCAIKKEDEQAVHILACDNIDKSIFKESLK